MSGKQDAKLTSIGIPLTTGFKNSCYKKDRNTIQKYFHQLIQLQKVSFFFTLNVVIKFYYIVNYKYAVAYKVQLPKTVFECFTVSKSLSS